MTHTFIINTENVNEYGYRVLTDGIDFEQYMRNPIVLFMHEREYQKSGKEKGKAVIGRCLKLYKDGTVLKADIEFDIEDDFAKTIAGKVERNFIRMASMFADVKGTSSDPELILSGQQYETVTKCKLVEISIVDVGGNDDALKLSKNGQPITLKKVNLNNKKDMSKLTIIALALGLSAESTEEIVSTEVQKLKLAKENADAQVVVLKGKLKEIVTAEATTLVDKAIALGLFPEAIKASQLSAFENDFDGQKAILSKMIGDAEATGKQSSTTEKIKEVVLSAGGSKTVPSTEQESFDYLQKHNVVELARIREAEPAKYAKLAKEYEQGVRYSK